MERPNLALASVVLVGGLLLVAAQVVQLVEVAQDLEGSALGMFLLASVGNMVAGIGLVLLGGWGSRSPGARAAFLIAGVFLLAQGSTFAQLGGLFGRFG